MRLTLCGSARFEKTFHDWNERLTAHGHVVYGLAVYPSSKEGQKNWYSEDEKIMLDLVHLAKIDNSDGVVVLNVQGYIGPSTSREIKWAELKNKRVFYIEQHDGFQDASIL